MNTKFFYNVCFGGLLSRISELNHQGLIRLLAVTSIHKPITGACILLSTECKIFDSNTFANESIIQHVGCSCRLGIEYMPSNVSDLLALLSFHRI